MIKGQKEGGPFVVAVEATRMPMIFVDALSADNRILYANDSFLKLMGYKQNDEIVGKPFTDTISDIQTNKKIILKDSSDQTPRSLHYVNGIRKSGDTFTAALLIAPVNDQSGQTCQFFISFVDISEQMNIGEAQQKRLRDLYKHAPGFIAMTAGPAHRITFANVGYRSLVGPRSLIGKTAAEAFPELADQGVIELLDNVFISRRPFSGQRVPVLLRRQEDGPLETRFIDFVYQPMLDAKNSVTGLLCQGFDVTDFEQREAELRLLQAQYVELSRLNAMGTMAATLAHELNQPLAAISNYAAGCIALLRDSGLAAGQINEGLEAIAKASDRAGHVIRRLRDMMKRAAPSVEHFDLADSVTDAIQLVKAGSFCEVAIASSSSVVVLVRADRIQTQQVIINLLKNACEAAAHPGEGNVTVSISSASDEIKLSVADEGVGISAEKQKTLFSWTESEKSDGMGMGLSISRTIIENQGGKIWLERTSDRGSEFAFTLPAAPKQEQRITTN